jgi:hypothetical protein
MSLGNRTDPVKLSGAHAKLSEVFETRTGACGPNNLGGSATETDGTSWLMDGGEVASGTECAVISGTRLMLNKSLARVLASLVRLGLARC